MLWGGSALCCICRRLEIPSHVLGTCSIFDMIEDDFSCSLDLAYGRDVRFDSAIREKYPSTFP
jgi:hypothetical protein